MRIRFSPFRLDRNARPGYGAIVDAIINTDEERVAFLRLLLSRLGLRVNEEQGTVPQLTPMHLSSNQPGAVIELLHSLREIISDDEQGRWLRDDHDTFQIIDASAFDLSELRDTLPRCAGHEPKGTAEGEENASKTIKRLVVYQSMEPVPLRECTPKFDHEAYYKHLKEYQQTTRTPLDRKFGTTLLYGEVMTSTNTLLEKNTALLRHLPAGFIATATAQIAGRGRGSNVWVSPTGSLMFSMVVRHETELMATAPVIFLQYIAAMAVVEGIHSYADGFDQLPVRLKWPNDIYALDATQAPGKNSYVKIGGVLVNSHYNVAEYISVIGIGLNTNNSLPTTSLAALLPPRLPRFTSEKLLARIVTAFSSLYTHFRSHGFDSRLERKYYAMWLHTDQLVTLETEGGARARIKGLTTDWGFLKAEELTYTDQPTGRVVQLQPDSNSFDFFKGLVKRKI